MNKYRINFILTEICNLTVYRYGIKEDKCIIYSLPADHDKLQNKLITNKKFHKFHSI